MDKLAIYCKSFRDDFGRLDALVSSWREFSPEIPFVLSVPSEDRELLKGKIDLPQKIQVVADEDYLGEDNASKYGWMQQQMCKLAVGRLGVAENYYMIDSDAYFISPVEDKVKLADDKVSILASSIEATYRSNNADLIQLIQEGAGDPEANVDGIDRAELTENLLSAYKEHKSGPGLPAQDRRRYLRDIFGDPRDQDGKRIAFAPSPIFNVQVLDELEKWLAAQNFNWRDAIYLSPWEYSWYGLFALRAYSGEVRATQPTCIHFPTDTEAQNALKAGVTESDLSKRFCAVQMAARHYDRLRFGE